LLVGFPMAASPASSHAAGLALLQSLGLTDEHGQTLNADRLHGRVVRLNFIFTRCDTSCPIQTEQLAAVERALSPEARAHAYFVSVTVDPVNDTPAVLKQYADQRRLNLAQWALVTGTPDQIGRLTRSFDAFAASSSSPRRGRHTTDLRLFDTRGRFMSATPGSRSTRRGYGARSRP
jgi:protein SCO1/2